MDSSPRPQRRFSRWQTTKRTFVLGGVTYKPPEAKVITQENDDKSVTRKTRKLNVSRNDSVMKQTLPSSRVSVAKQLVFHINGKSFTENAADVAESSVPPAPEDNIMINDSSASGRERLHLNTESDKSERTDTPSSHDLILQHERVDERNKDNTAALNSKSALSDISQNTSADKSATQTSSSQSRVHVTQNIVTRRKRQADDEESSDTSSTDKENKDKDKDPSDTDAPPSKKLIQDATLHDLSLPTTNNMPTGKSNISQSNSQNTTLTHLSEVSSVLSARRSTLRNRDMLPSPEAMLKKRQYPIHYSSGKRSVLVRTTLEAKEINFNKRSVGKKETDLNKKASEKKQMPQSEITPKQQSPTKPAKKSPVQKFDIHIKDKTVNSVNHEVKKQNKPLNKRKLQNTSETTKTSRTSVGLSSTSSLSLHMPSPYSQQTSSDSKRSSLRDRSKLTTPEEMLERRLYPARFMLSRRELAEAVSVNSVIRQEVSSKRKQKHLIQSYKLTPEQPKHTSSSKDSEQLFTSSKPEITINETNQSSSSALKDLAAKELSMHKKSRKLLVNSHNTTAEKTVNSIIIKNGHQLGSGEKCSRRKEHKKHPKCLMSENQTRLDSYATFVHPEPNLAKIRRNGSFYSECDGLQEFSQEPANKKIHRSTAAENHKTNGDRVPESRRKLLPSKVAKRQYSLPRPQSKKSSFKELHSGKLDRGNTLANTLSNTKLQASQLSHTIVDTSQKPPTKKQSGKLEIVPNTEAETVQTHAPNKSSEISFNRIIAGPKKQPRKRKLLVELDEVEKNNMGIKAKGHEVNLWCEDGRPRRGSDITAFDVILQAVADTEEILLYVLSDRIC